MRNEEEIYQSNENVLEKLSNLNQKISVQKSGQRELYRQYVGLYVSKTALSEDFFIMLCEHNFVQKLFKSHKQVGSMTILQCFHLLLANTTQINSLVYLFSQSKLHQFLFQSFDINKQQHQAIEYYVQLLKAIIMRMTSGGMQLVQMFCNNRTPSFPLLTAASSLAISSQSDQLVKVTAQQCVLFLVSLLNTIDIGRGYLSQLQMIIFYHELTMDLIKTQRKDQQGSIKYLVDLLGALSHTSNAFLVLMNIVVNIVILRQSQNTPIVLRFVRTFTSFIAQSQIISLQKKKQSIILVTHIINRLYFSRFVHSTYLASAKNLPSRLLFPRQDLSSSISKRGQDLGTLLIQNTQQKQLKLMHNWGKFNRDSEQIIKLKQGGQRKSRTNSIFGFFAAKTNPAEQYLNQVLEMSGLRNDQLNVPLGQLNTTINYKTSLYIVQQMLLKQKRKGQNINQYDAHCNETQGKFQLNQAFCQQILNMLKSIEAKNKNLQQNCQQTIECHFQLAFLQKLSSFLKNNIGDYLLPQQPSIKLNSLYFINQIGKKLQICGNLERRAKNWLLRKSQQIQTNIHELTIQNDFRHIIDYIKQNRTQKYLSQPCSYSPGTSLLRIQIQQQVFKYQTIRIYLDPTLPSINAYTLSRWVQHVSNAQFRKKHTITHFDQNQGELTIGPSQSFIGFKGSYRNQQQLFRFEIKDKDGEIFSQIDTMILFSEMPKGFNAKSSNHAKQLNQQLDDLQLIVEEFIIKIIPSYFEKTHNRLCQKLNSDKK